ncbi:hypothetical protein ACA910_010597 [Epithemia clementina (nom. ined.)]
MFKRKPRKSTGKDAEAAAAVDEELLEAFEYVVDYPEDEDAFVEMIEVGDDFLPIEDSGEAMNGEDEGSPTKKKRSKSKKKKKKKKHKKHKKHKKSGTDDEEEENGEETDGEQDWDVGNENNNNNDKDNNNTNNDDEIVDLLTAANYMSDDSLDRMVEERSRFSRYTAMDDDDFQQLPAIAGDDRYTANPTFPGRRKSGGGTPAAATAADPTGDMDDNSEPAQWRSWDKDEEEEGAAAAAVSAIAPGTTAKEQNEAPIEKEEMITDPVDAIIYNTAKNININNNNNNGDLESASMPYVLEGAISLGFGNEGNEEEETENDDDGEAEEKTGAETLSNNPSNSLSQQQQNQQQPLLRSPSPQIAGGSGSLNSKRSSRGSSGGGDSSGKYNQLIKEKKTKDHEKRKQKKLAKQLAAAAAAAAAAEGSLIGAPVGENEGGEEEEGDEVKNKVQAVEEKNNKDTDQGENERNGQDEHAPPITIRLTHSETSSLTDPLAAPKPWKGSNLKKNATRDSGGMPTARSIPPMIVETTRRIKEITDNDDSNNNKNKSTDKNETSKNIATDTAVKDSDKPPQQGKEDKAPKQSELPDESKPPPPPPPTVEAKETKGEQGKEKEQEKPPLPLSSTKTRRRSRSFNYPSIRMTLSPVVISGDRGDDANTEQGIEDTRQGGEQKRWFSVFTSKSKDAAFTTTEEVPPALTTQTTPATNKSSKKEDKAGGLSPSARKLIGRSRSKEAKTGEPAAPFAAEEQDENKPPQGKKAVTTPDDNPTNAAPSEPDKDQKRDSEQTEPVLSVPEKHEQGTQSEKRSSGQLQISVTSSFRESDDPEDTDRYGSPRDEHILAEKCENSQHGSSQAVQSRSTLMRNASCQTSLTPDDEAEEGPGSVKRRFSLGKRSTGSKQSSRRSSRSKIEAPGLQVLSPLAPGGSKGSRHSKSSRGPASKIPKSTKDGKQTSQKTDHGSKQSGENQKSKPEKAQDTTPLENDGKTTPLENDGKKIDSRSDHKEKTSRRHSVEPSKDASKKEATNSTDKVNKRLSSTGVGHESLRSGPGDSRRRKNVDGRNPMPSNTDNSLVESTHENKRAGPSTTSEIIGGLNQSSSESQESDPAKFDSNVSTASGRPPTPGQLSQADVKMMYTKSLVSGTEDSVPSQENSGSPVPEQDWDEEAFPVSEQSTNNHKNYLDRNKKEANPELDIAKKHVEDHQPAELDEFAIPVVVQDEAPLVQCLKFYNLNTAATVARVFISATDCRSNKATHESYEMRMLGPLSADEIHGRHNEKFHSQQSPKVEVVLDEGRDLAQKQFPSSASYSASVKSQKSQKSALVGPKQILQEIDDEDDTTQEAPDIGHSKSYVREITGMRFHLDEDWEAQEQEKAIRRAKKKAAEQAMSIKMIEIPIAKANISIGTSETSSSESRDPVEDEAVESILADDAEKISDTLEEVEEKNEEADEEAKEAPVQRDDDEDRVIEVPKTPEKKERKGFLSVLNRIRSRRSAASKTRTQNATKVE